MNVILIEDVEHLGHKGAVKKVAPGYARNYLIPLRKAVPATPARLAQHNKLIQIAEQKRLELEEAYKEMAEQLRGISLSIKERATAKNQLYGSVDVADIVALIKKEKNLTIDPRSVKLDQPLKEIGHHDITVQFDSTIQATFSLVIQPEEVEKSPKDEKQKTKTSSKVKKN